MLSVINLEAERFEVVVDRLNVRHDGRMLVTQEEVHDAENCGHEQRLLDDDLHSHIDDDGVGAVADVHFRALDRHQQADNHVKRDSDEQNFPANFQLSAVVFEREVKVTEMPRQPAVEAASLVEILSVKKLHFDQT